MAECLTICYNYELTVITDGQNGVLCKRLLRALNSVPRRTKGNVGSQQGTETVCEKRLTRSSQSLLPNV